MMNRVTLIGNLGADPEIRSLNDGGKVSTLRVATTESWKDRDSGERREKTEWHRVTVWGEPSAKYLNAAQKGTQVMVEGKLTTRKWTDNDGVERYSTEITVNEISGLKILSRGVPREQEEKPPAQSRRSRTSSRTRQQPTENFSADLDDEIPF